MFVYILIRIIISVAIILSIHWGWLYLIAMYTVPKVHDVEELTKRQYQQIANALKNNNVENVSNIDMKDELTDFAKQYV